VEKGESGGEGEKKGGGGAERRRKRGGDTAWPPKPGRKRNVFGPMKDLACWSKGRGKKEKRETLGPVPAGVHEKDQRKGGR